MSTKIGPMERLPSTRTDSGSGITLACVNSSPTPRSVIIVPSVVISGLMPSTTTMKPLSMPNAMPHSTVTENAATGFQPSRVISNTPIELDRKAIEPREMSRFPVITTIAMPQDMITTGAIVCSMAIMLPNSRKCGVARLKKTKIAASTSTKPQSSSKARSEADESFMAPARDADLLPSPRRKPGARRGRVRSPRIPS